MTKIINFDEIQKPAAVAIVYKGKRHEMVEATVDSFLTNMKAVDALGLDASPTEEIEVTIGIILRAFPTLTDAIIREWTLEMIKQLSEIVRGAGGEVASTDEEAVKEANASGNAPAAS